MHGPHRPFPDLLAYLNLFGRYAQRNLKGVIPSIPNSDMIDTYYGTSLNSLLESEFNVSVQNMLTCRYISGPLGRWSYQPRAKDN